MACGSAVGQLAVTRRPPCSELPAKFIQIILFAVHTVEHPMAIGAHRNQVINHCFLAGPGGGKGYEMVGFCVHTPQFAI